MIISLMEYAKVKGKEQSVVRRLAENGRFFTAKKIGRNWTIDSDEPYPADRRLKSRETDSKKDKI